ncbi:hypothetical protein HGM15179_019499 [Zosterops borbonicus]|uniref:Uncharacterized protein n=1 Tax=Zosterops borbonicus TaxID=364589 RepID=A0A8K1D817_9PASS|nr:hypothetical protein HGM15179_019499 [Zosterops borbonicus]
MGQTLKKISNSSAWEFSREQIQNPDEVGKYMEENCHDDSKEKKLIAISWALAYVYCTLLDTVGQQIEAGGQEDKSVTTPVTQAAANTPATQVVAKPDSEPKLAATPDREPEPAVVAKADSEPKTLAVAAGKVERDNGLLKTTLKALGRRSFKNWEQHLAKATWLVNTQVSTNRAGPAQSDLLHTVDGDKVPVVHVRSLLEKTVWINSASRTDKPIRGIVFAQGPGCTWWIMQKDGT